VDVIDENLIFLLLAYRDARFHKYGLRNFYSRPHTMRVIKSTNRRQGGIKIGDVLSIQKYLRNTSKENMTLNITIT
jgi:hypothetical protein